MNRFWKDERAEDVADKMFGYAIGLLVLAYVAYEGIKAMVNTTYANGTSSAITVVMSTVVPLIAAIGGIYLLYNYFRRKK